MRAILVTALVLTASTAWASDWREGAHGYDQAVFEQQHTQIPMLVYVRTDWCPHCKALEAQVMKLPKAAEFLDVFVKVKINPETGTPEEKIAQSLGVTAYPSMYVINSGAKPVKVSVGENMTADQFIKSIRAVSGDPTKAPAAAKSAPAPTAAPAKFERPDEITNAIEPEILNLQNAGQHSEAVARLNQEIKRATRNGTAPDPALYYARALSYRALHNHASAAEDLVIWVKAHPDDAKARELLARSYLNLTMYDDASRELAALTRDHPTGELLFLLAEAQTKAGKAGDAKGNYAASCKLGYKAACAK